MELITAHPTMTTREVADLIEKQHSNIKISAERLSASGVIGTLAPQEFTHNGNTYTEYLLCKRDSLILVAQNCPEFTARIIDRWQELESKSLAALPDFSNPVAAARAWADQMEKAQVLAIERDKAIATKAQIGSKREATAMANVAKANKEVTRLMDRLGFNARHATIKAVEGAVKRSFGPQGWRPLSNWCKANGATAIDVPDPLYGSVKSWPADAWGEIYDIDLKDLFPATETAVGA